MKNRLVGVMLVIFGAVLGCAEPSPTPSGAQPAKHPMDPLTAEEYSAAVRVLNAANFTSEASLYPLITLYEPAKSKVLQWRPGDIVGREAFAIVKNGSETFEAVVDLAAGKVTSWKEVRGVEPSFLGEEWKSAMEAVKAHPGWQAAVRRRGINNFEGVVCLPQTAGYYGLAEEEGRRLFKAFCTDTRETKNKYARPIEGALVHESKLTRGGPCQEATHPPMLYDSGRPTLVI